MTKNKKLTTKDPDMFKKLCAAYLLDPKKIKDITLDMSLKPEENYIHFDTIDERRLTFPVGNKAAHKL